VSIAPSARNGVGAIGKTPLTSTVSMGSAFVWVGGGFADDQGFAALLASARE
jgi:hypothetical protein